MCAARNNRVRRPHQPTGCITASTATIGCASRCGSRINWLRHPQPVGETPTPNRCTDRTQWMLRMHPLTVFASRDHWFLRPHQLCAPPAHYQLGEATPPTGCCAHTHWLRSPQPLVPPHAPTHTQQPVPQDIAERQQSRQARPPDTRPPNTKERAKTGTRVANRQCSLMSRRRKESTPAPTHRSNTQKKTTQTKKNSGR